MEGRIQGVTNPISDNFSWCSTSKAILHITNNVVLLRWLMICVVRIDSNILLMTQKADRSVLWWRGHSPEFLTGQIDAIFQELGKRFSIRQQLKRFCSTGESSGVWFLKVHGNWCRPYRWVGKWVRKSCWPLINQIFCGQCKVESLAKGDWSLPVWNLKQR